MASLARSSMAKRSGACSKSNAARACGSLVRRRIRNHRGEARLGGELAFDQHPPRELADLAAILDQVDLDTQQHAGLDRLAELRPVDRHEIDELARAGE